MLFLYGTNSFDSRQMEMCRKDKAGLGRSVSSSAPNLTELRGAGYLRSSLEENVSASSGDGNEGAKIIWCEVLEISEMRG